MFTSSGWTRPGPHAGDDSDAGKLLLTDAQVGALTTGVDGKALHGFRVALVHHPLSDLYDASHVRVLLADNVDLLLRGHLHEATVETSVDPDRTSRQLAAGCLYGSDRWPNSCHAIEVHLDDGGRPLRYELRFRRWAEKGHWFDDGGVYREARGGRLSWQLTPTLTTPPPPPPRSGVFVGREEELRQIASSVLPEERKPVALCALQGMPGIGKTYLAEHFFAENQQRFPGGLRRLIIDPRAPQTADLLLGQLADQLKLNLERTGLAERLREHLLHPLALLLVENVDSEPAAKVAVELVRKLHGCPLILTGRFRGLGTSVGWTVVDVPPLLEKQALQQLEQEWRPPLAHELKERKDLANELGYLPLALHLAASYLQHGAHNVSSFLAELRARKLKLGPRDPADPLWITPHDPARAVLASTIELSLELLREQLGADTERMLSGLAALGHASTSGFGASLGAAISGLSESEFRRLVHHALELSVIAPVPRTERPEGAWRIHPLVAELLRDRSGASEGPSRMTAWFLARLPELPPGQEEEQGHRWREVRQETGALVDWLTHVPEADIAQVERAGSTYAQFNGPYTAWLVFCEGALTLPLQVDEQSSILWTLANVALRGGALGRALQAAGEKARIDQELGNKRGLAFASGIRADILQARGELDEALRIRREEELPVYEMLGDIRSRAVTQGQISDILQARGELDEALRIRREEMLPVYEKLGDVRERAVAQGKIADILQDRGELDEALRIRREEEMPVYEKLGDVRARAMVQGRIADILQMRGELDEALRILRQEVLPVLEKLEEVRSRAIVQARIANILRARGGLDEALRILREEVLPVFEKLGDVRSRAVAQGKIADILQARGEFEEALRIWSEEVLPAFKKLGDVRGLLVGRTNLAVLYLRRNYAGDREHAIELLRLARAAAEALRIPEAGLIRQVQQHFGLE
jgi:tetratricopeptide (TPR) repeat protein